MARLRRVRELRFEAAARKARAARDAAAEARGELQGRHRELAAAQADVEAVVDASRASASLDVIDRADIGDAMTLGRLRVTRAAAAVSRASFVSQQREAEARDAQDVSQRTRLALDRWDKLVERVTKEEAWAEESRAEHAGELDSVIRSRPIR
jgi:hypothetical protein